LKPKQQPRLHKGGFSRAMLNFLSIDSRRPANIPVVTRKKNRPFLLTAVLLISGMVFYGIMAI